MSKKRIVIDTNLWISFLITNNFDEFQDLIDTWKVTILFSDELFEEFFDVVNRPKFKKYFSKKDVQKLLGIIPTFSELIIISSNLNQCRDKKDNFLLNLSVDGKADFLLTGDQDLLDLRQIEKTEILSFRQLIDKLNIRKTN